MKRILAVFLASVLILLCGCASAEPAPTEAPTSTPAPTPAPTATPEPTPAPTPRPEHSISYVPGCEFDAMFEAFREIALSSEYPTEVYAPVLHKWVTPVFYFLSGEYTEADESLVDLFFQLLSYLKGFPGAAKAPDENHANMLLHFCGTEEFYERVGSAIDEEEANGAVQYWYSGETNELVRAEICYRNDTLDDPNRRTSVVLEEIINGIGATNDTVLREDSILYQYGAVATFPSDVDWTLISLIYDPLLKPGMDETQCREILETLYW